MQLAPQPIPYCQMNPPPPRCNINNAKDHLNQCAWTQFIFTAEPQKWLRPTAVKSIPPLPLPPTPNPTSLHKPTEGYPTTWFTVADLELKYLTLNHLLLTTHSK